MTFFTPSPDAQTRPIPEQYDEPYGGQHNDDYDDDYEDWEWEEEEAQQEEPQDGAEPRTWPAPGSARDGSPLVGL